MSPTLEVYGPYLIFFAIALFIVPYHFRQAKKRLDNMGRQLFGPQNYRIMPSGISILGFNLGYILVGHRDDNEFRIFDHTGSKHSPPHTTVGIPCSISMSFTISPEGVISGLSKKVGLMHELEIGRPDLDEAFVIRFKDENQGRNFCQHPEFHIALEKLLRVHRLDSMYTSSGIGGRSQVRIRSGISVKVYGHLGAHTANELKLICDVLTHAKAAQA